MTNCLHCQTEIDEHEANRCLDAWVAEAVMGEIMNAVGCWSPHDGGSGITLDVNLPLSHYSTDIAAAWEVVERAEIISVCRAWDVDMNPKGWTAWADDPSMANADTAPLAICRAALKTTVKEFA